MVMRNSTQPWVLYKNQYQTMMDGYHSDIGLYVPVERPATRLEDAVDYVTTKGEYEYAPGKKICTSLIWAVLACRLYGGDVRDRLNDPTLIDRGDRMVLYEDDPGTYESLLETLGDGVEWIGNGWGPWSAFYFWAECTAEGYAALEEHFINDTLDDFIPENYIEKIKHLWGG